MQDSMSALNIGITKLHVLHNHLPEEKRVEFSAVGALKFEINIALSWNTGNFGVIRR